MKCIFLVVFIVLNIVSFAQNTKRNTVFSLACEGAIPATSQAFKVYKAGFGGSAKILFPTGKKNFFTASLGVISFAGRAGSPSEIFGTSLPLTNVNIAHPPLTTIPIKFGYRYQFNSKFHGEAEFGYTYGQVLGLVQPVTTADVSGLTYALGFGRLILNKVDVSLRYEMFRTRVSETNYTAFVGLRSLIFINR